MLDLASEIWRLILARKKFVLLPVIVMTVLMGLLLVLTEGSAVAPFIYAIF